MQRRGHPAGWFIADRAYLPGGKPERFQIPLRYRLVFDYRSDQIGRVQEPVHGAIQIEGSYFCPATPKHLIEATKVYREGGIDDEHYAQLLDTRRAWMLRPKERPKHPAAPVPMMCPATGPSPTISCPLRPASQEPPRVQKTRFVVFDPPEHPQAICINKRSVTFKNQDGAKYRQELPYGTVHWQKRYALGRNYIESKNGDLKDGGHEALADPTRRRLHGYAYQMILVALLAFAANMRAIRAFTQRAIQLGGQPVVLPSRRRRPRRRPAETPVGDNAEMVNDTG